MILPSNPTIIPRSLIELLHDLVEVMPDQRFAKQMLERLEKWPIYEDMPPENP